MNCRPPQEVTIGPNHGEYRKLENKKRLVRFLEDQEAALKQKEVRIEYIILNRNQKLTQSDLIKAILTVKDELVEHATNIVARVTVALKKNEPGKKTITMINKELQQFNSNVEALLLELDSSAFQFEDEMKFKRKVIKEAALEIIGSIKKITSYWQSIIDQNPAHDTVFPGLSNSVEGFEKLVENLSVILQETPFPLISSYEREPRDMGCSPHDHLRREKEYKRMVLLNEIAEEAALQEKMIRERQIPGKSTKVGCERSRREPIVGDRFGKVFLDFFGKSLELVRIRGILWSAKVAYDSKGDKVVSTVECGPEHESSDWECNVVLELQFFYWSEEQASFKKRTFAQFNAHDRKFTLEIPCTEVPECKKSETFIDIEIKLVSFSGVSLTEPMFKNPEFEQITRTFTRSFSKIASIGTERLESHAFQVDGHEWTAKIHNSKGFLNVEILNWEMDKNSKNYYATVKVRILNQTNSSDSITRSEGGELDFENIGWLMVDIANLETLAREGYIRNDKMELEITINIFKSK